MWFFLFQSARKIFVIRYFHSSSNVRFQSLAACFNQTQMSGSLFLLPPVPLEASIWLWINPNLQLHSFTRMTHTFLMWGETSLKVFHLCRAPLKAVFYRCCQCFSCFSSSFFTFRLISTCLYRYLTQSLSISSLFRVLLDVLQFFWRLYKQNNREHLCFFVSLYLSQGDFPRVLFNWLKIEAFVPFLLLTGDRVYPTCLETWNQSFCKYH